MKSPHALAVGGNGRREIFGGDVFYGNFERWKFGFEWYFWYCIVSFCLRHLIYLMSRTHKLPLVKVAKFSLSFRYLRCLLYVVRCILILYKKCIPGLSLSDCNCSSLQTRLGPKIYIHQHDKKEAYQDPTIIDYRSIDINYCVQVSSTARYVFVSSYLKN